MKKFYNNTLIGGAFSKALRVIALLCVLMGFSANAMAAYYATGPAIGNGEWGNNNWVEMTLVDGVYKCPATAGKEFKISNDKNWNDSYWGELSAGDNVTKGDNGGNGRINDGDYNTLCFGGDSNKWFWAENNGGGSSTTYYLKGSFNGWNTSNPFSNGICTISLSANTTYTFKIQDSNDSWYGNTGTIEASITGWTFDADANCTLKTSIAGDYKFTWHEDTKKLDVTYPTGGGGGGGSDCNKTGNFYITGPITGGWGGSYWNQMQLTEDGKGHYYFWAQEKGDFKMNITANWDSNNDWWKGVKVSSECSDITYSSDGANATLKTANVYIKYNPCTGYIWTEPVQCSEAPVYTVPEVVTIGVGESIDLSKICSSTSDATITFTKKSGTAATLNGTTLTAGQTAGTVVIKATQPLKTPYCSGSVEFSVNIVEKSIILLAEDAVKDNKDNWTLSAYLEATNCEKTDETITEYGFFLCGTETNGGCVPTSLSHNINIKKEGTLLKGAHFTGVVNASDVVSDWYGYRSYVKFSDDSYQLSSETRYFTDCNTVFGDTIYVTIDNTLTANSKCDFRFKSFDDAWATLKTHKTICTVENVTIGNQTQEKITLVKPVVMQVVPNLQEPYKGTEAVGITGGDIHTAKALFFRNINMNGGKELVVRSINKTGKRATLQHIAIRRSKNITLDYINITGTSKDLATADNALDIDNGEGTGPNNSNPEGLSKSWNCATQGGMTNANINIKNCYIESHGFTCIHISAYDGVTLENNEIKAMFDFEKASTNDANNTALWGASAKFLNSENIKFVRNNFTGMHATSILIQGSQKVLIYDNVFWHENAVKSSANTVAIIRLMSFNGDDEKGCSINHPVQNIGIYYNTMFLKDNDKGKGYYHYFDFFRVGSNRAETVNFTGNYYPGTIEFDYNNCYSYDLDVYGKNYTGSKEYTANNNTKYLQTMSESDWCGSFKYNNFWSAYEEEKATPKPTQSAFTLGSGCSTNSGKNTFTNVKNLVCKTAAEEPGSLVIKGDGLNIGAYIKTDESGLLTSDMQMIDRLGNARPYDPSHTEGAGKYTVGAYQQSLGNELSKIIWNGNVSTDWDNRNNWYKPNGQLVTCVDILTEDLEVVIPAPNTTKYPVPEGGVLQYPKLPNIVEETDFSTTRATTWFGEEVTAGKGQVSKPTQIANSITMEYGAALIGVEQLAKEGKTERYNQASTELIVPRSKWILVGPIIRPFDSKGQARDMVSGDYFIEKQEPHVWMHEATMNSTSVAWKNPFPDLNVVVPANKVFAIQIADMYGTGFMLPAEVYNKIKGTNYDGTKPIQYTFTGRFTNEGALPTYTLTAKQPALLNNSYPANINVATLKAKKGGTIQTYNYASKSFGEVSEGLIIAQHGFVYTSEATSLEIPLEAFETSNTEHRSGLEILAKASVKVSNEKAQASSTVNVTVDWLKEDVINYDTDAPKVFNAQETKLPDLYIMRYNEKWAGVRVPTHEEPIPLGIRVSAEDQIFVFSLENMVNMSSVILEDRFEGKNYNLSAGETCTVEGLEIGDCEGRFFLNLGEPKEEESDDTTTDVEDISSDKGISIISTQSSVIVSCSSDIELQTIYINDMSGKTTAFRVSGQYVEIELPVAQGVYTVNVIGDTASKTGKVILK